MTVVLKERASERLFDTGEERTLDDVVTTAWGGLGVRGSARCLVCGTTVTRDAGGSDAVECASCGSSLD